MESKIQGKIKHPHEIDMSEFENDMPSFKRSDNKLDCDIFYRRIVKHLFKKEKFHLDPGSDYYVANVPLRLKKQQWELLVDLNTNGLNLNEIDDLLADVLKQSNDSDWDFPVSQILLEIYRRQLLESMPSLNSPVVLFAIALLVIFFTSRLFSVSKLTFSALILFVTLGIFGLSYGMSYWDCLSDLEVEQMIKLSETKSANNPCKDYHGEHASVWSSVWAKVAGSSEDKCYEHMRKTFKPSRNYCDPLDVAAKWAAKIQMSYFSSMFVGFMELIASFTSSSNFMTKVIVWAVGALIFGYFLLSFGKEVIINSFKGAFSMLTTTRISTESTSAAPSSDYQLLSAKMDKIIYENREMKRELSIIRECSVERSISVEPEAAPRIVDARRLPPITENSS